jgi:hypothetical protein
MAAGIAADKVGKYNVFVVACGTTGIFTLALWIPASGDSALIAFTVIFGFFSGAYVSLLGGLAAQISPIHEIGYRTGLVFLVASVPGLVTNPIAGAIVSNTGSYTGLKAFSGAFIVVGTCVILATRIHFVGVKLNKIF